MSEAIKTRRRVANIEETPTYLYKEGDEKTSLTSGYSVVDGSATALTKNANSMLVKRIDGFISLISTGVKVDVVEQNTLFLDISMANISGDGVIILGLAETQTTTIENYLVNMSIAENTARTIISLDISTLTGSLFLLFRTGGSAGTTAELTIHNIYMQ